MRKKEAPEAIQHKRIGCEQGYISTLLAQESVNRKGDIGKSAKAYVAIDGNDSILLSFIYTSICAVSRLVI